MCCMVFLYAQLAVRGMNLFRKHVYVQCQYACAFSLHPVDFGQSTLLTKKSNLTHFVA